MSAVATLSPNFAVWWKIWILGGERDRALATACLKSGLPPCSVVSKVDDGLRALDAPASSLQLNQEPALPPPLEEESVRAHLGHRCPQVAVVLASQNSAAFDKGYLTRTTRVWIWRPSAMPAWSAHPFLVGCALDGNIRIQMDTPSLSFGDVVHQDELGAPEVQVEEALLKMEPVCRILRAYQRATCRFDSLHNALPQRGLDESQASRL